MRDGGFPAQPRFLIEICAHFITPSTYGSRLPYKYTYRLLFSNFMDARKHTIVVSHHISSQ